MPKEYDPITAFHYASFRPALHSQILKEYFVEEHEMYPLGLDVGSGTGQSSIALSRYCERVIGIEPSEEMLKNTIKQSGVEYALYDCKSFDLEDNSFDIITFAGSLYYAKSQQLLNEVVRISKQNAKILVYDFELLLEEIIGLLTANNHSNKTSEYNHEEDLSGLDQKDLEIEKQLKKTLSLELSITNLSHLLLSVKDNYSLLCSIFGSDQLYEKVSQRLQSILEDKNIQVEAVIYLTVYRVI